MADPKGLKNWIKNKSSYLGSADIKLRQFNHIVRYLKRWRDERFSDDVASKIYSIGITVMVKESFIPSLTSDGVPDDLIALKSAVHKMLNNGYFRAMGNDQYKINVYLPVVPNRDIFDGASVDTATQFRNKMNRLDKKLDEVLVEEDEIKQCKILREMFGDDFPVPDKTKNSSNVKKAVYSSAGAAGTLQGA